MASITAIDGIKEPYTERLRRLGIRTTDDLLAYGASRRGRRELSKVVGLGDRRVTEWVKRADLDEGRRSDGLTSLERIELARLRRENQQLRLEREILSKAAAWFARETGSIPPRDSSS